MSAPVDVLAVTERRLPFYNRCATCRCCGVMQLSETMIKYSVRHYAHPKCALRKWGASFFDRLSPWQLERFPALVASKFGLLDELGRRIQSNAERAK